MISFSERACEQLKELVDEFSDIKTKGENGRSAFWLWIDAVKECSNNIDKLSKHNFSRKYGGYCCKMYSWGTIYYDKLVKNGDVYIGIKFYKINRNNLELWLRHKPLKRANNKWTITDLSSGLPDIKIVRSTANMYTWYDESKRKLVNPQRWYCQIGEFNSFGNTFVCIRDRKGYEYYRFIDTSLQYIGDLKYEQVGYTPQKCYFVKYSNGYYQILKPNLIPLDDNVYENVFIGIDGHLYGTILGKDYIIETKRPCRFKNIINESILCKIVSNVIKEIVNEEYKVVGRYETFDYGNGKKGHSIITLKDEYGGESKIIEDDGCYVLYNKVGDEYEPSPYIYPEALNAMKKLPNLPLR
ncbi:MAG: hypothetical protein ACI30V_04360 [Muribaculaceae bacterium]